MFVWVGEVEMLYVFAWRSGYESSQMEQNSSLYNFRQYSTRNQCPVHLVSYCLRDCQIVCVVVLGNSNIRGNM